MDNTIDIRLNGTNGKESVNVNESINIDLKRNAVTIPLSDVGTSVNLYELYNSERNACSKIRLVCTVNPICTNILHNAVSEIVKDEGSEDAVLLNLSQSNTINGVVCKSNSGWNYEKAILDTQISNDKCGFDYHCGYDILDNHIIRNLSFKTVNHSNSNSEDFNTISDTLRDAKGDDIYEANEFAAYLNGVSSTVSFKLYKVDDLLTYNQSRDKNTVDNNGWIGFYNKSNMISKYGNYSNYYYSKVINNKKACEFIDFYPGIKEYSFVPRYNEHRGRIEKNWNYCITYPSSSTTVNIPFINSSLSSLRCFVNEDAQPVDGVGIIAISSFSKHGLVDGDIINLYNNDKLILPNAEVTTYGEYDFTVFKSRENLNDENKETTFSVSSTSSIGQEGGDVVFNISSYSSGENDYSFKKISNGIECTYYVRIFSRLPNFRFADKEITEKLLYADEPDYMKKYQTDEYDFENHIYKLGFSKNVYSDDIAQVTYSDDIDISSLRDNLGRPLSSLYFTVIKNNKGYQKWYGKDGTPIDISSEDIEYSHCFGKVNCGFEYNYDSTEDFVTYQYGHTNIHLMENVDENASGLNISNINTNRVESIDDDEIDFYNDINYYGDLCCFSPSEYKEQSIQPVLNRFNTAQRELTDERFPQSFRLFNSFNSHEIFCDAYLNKNSDPIFETYNEGTGFTVSSITHNDLCSQREGYFYQPHYEIKIKSDSELNSSESNILNTLRLVYNDEIGEYYIKTSEMNFMGYLDDFVLYDKTNKKSYKCKVTCVLSPYQFNFKVVDGSEIDNIANYKDFVVARPSAATPSYAYFLNDGSCRYVWRDLIQNGFGQGENEEEYPFINGRLYAHLGINLYLKRQNPFSEYYEINTDRDSEGELYVEKNKGGSYYTSKEMKC